MSPRRACRRLGLAALLPLFAACVQTNGARWVGDASAPVTTSSVPLVAPNQGSSSAGPERTAEERDEPFKRHTVSVLTRVVTEDRAERGPAIGLDYEYRFHEDWGVGAFAEYVAGDLDTGVLGAMVNLHATERLLIGIGPGFETNSEETRALMRLGGLYEFQAGEVIIAPAVYWDWLDDGHHALLFGVNFGKKF